jgi:antitoxin component YwqK of YwqJK toxin-antitoxin module
MKEGKKHGELKQWNEQGELTLHEIYHEDELIEKIL